MTYQRIALEKLATLIKDGTHGTHKNVENGPYLLSAQNIENGNIIINENERRISKEDFNIIHRSYKLQNNDILITIVGSLGRCAILKNYNGDFTFQRSVAIIRFNKTRIIPKFAYYQIQTNAFQKELTRRESKGAQGGVYLGELAKIQLLVPDLETQQKIVQVLDDTDKYLTLLKQKAILEERKEAKLAKILLSKSDYKTTTLRSLCDYEQPQKYLVSNNSYQENGTPVLTANKAFVLGYTNETNGIYEARNNPIVLLDDFTCDCKYVDFNFKIKSSAIKILKPKKNTTAIILYWILKNISIDISGEHKRHYLSELINKKVPIMDNMASKNISNILKSEKDIINNIKKEICKTETLYKYLLNHLISDDFDLTNIKLENEKEQQ